MPELDSVFGALSDPIRRAMLAALAQGELAVSALGAPFPISAPAVSKHLRVLEKSRLIERRKRGRVHYCRLRPEPLQEAVDWIERQREFWERQFEALDKYLAKEQEACTPPQSNENESPSGSNGGSTAPAKPSFAHGRTRKS